jgi:hypothetical protein
MYESLGNPLVAAYPHKSPFRGTLSGNSRKREVLALTKSLGVLVETTAASELMDRPVRFRSTFRFSLSFGMAPYKAKPDSQFFFSHPISDLRALT